MKKDGWSIEYLPIKAGRKVIAIKFRFSRADPHVQVAQEEQAAAQPPAWVTEGLDQAFDQWAAVATDDYEDCPDLGDYAYEMAMESCATDDTEYDDEPPRDAL